MLSYEMQFARDEQQSRSALPPAFRKARSTETSMGDLSNGRESASRLAIQTIGLSLLCPCLLDLPIGLEDKELLGSNVA